jgi:hypothetical protein
MLSHTTPHTRTHWPPAHCAASVPVVVASRDPARAAAVSLDVVVVAEGCLKLPRQQRTGAVQTEVLYESDWFLLFRHTHTWLLCWNCRRGVWNKGQRWPWEFACIVLLRTVSDPNAPIHPPREQLLSVHFFSLGPLAVWTVCIFLGREFGLIHSLPSPRPLSRESKVSLFCPQAAHRTFSLLTCGKGDGTDGERMYVCMHACMVIDPRTMHTQQNICFSLGLLGGANWECSVHTERTKR